MMETQQTNQVVQFAALLCGDGPDAAVEAARERGWVDPCGRITDMGRQLYRALADQRETRSIYRSLF